MSSIDNDLVELVFEGLSASTAMQLVEDILGKKVALPTIEESAVDLEVPRLALDARTALQKVHLRLFRYGGQFDVEVNFVPRDAGADSLETIIDALHQYALTMGERHNIDSYYAGIEPAADAETRFFTGTVRGPY